MFTLNKYVAIGSSGISYMIGRSNKKIPDPDSQWHARESFKYPLKKSRFFAYKRAQRVWQIVVQSDCLTEASLL